MCPVLCLFLIVTATAQESRFNEVKQCNVTTDVIYTPPMMIVGKSDGTIVRCPVATPYTCEEYHVGNSSVTFTVVHGEYLFASLASGVVLRCVLAAKHSCVVFHQIGSEAAGMAVTAGFLYVGLRDGTILRCKLGTPHCRTIATLENFINSFTAIDSVLYVGSQNRRIESCSTTSQSCSAFCETSSIVGMLRIGDKIFGITHHGFLVTGVIASKQCTDFSVLGYGYKSVAVYNRKLFLIGNLGNIYVYDPYTDDGEHSDVVILPLYAKHKDAISISFAYGTHAIQNMSVCQSLKDVPKCPSVIQIQDRFALEVTVKNGKLYSQGALVDTSDADNQSPPQSTNGNHPSAAIFVMGPDGQILLSKAGVHNSSLLADNPVSGAGLMVVNQGKIISITACDDHYRPNQGLNAQIKESLFLKGYTDPIDSHDCNYSEISSPENVVNTVVENT